MDAMNVYYFGTKANPLTLGHERIIKNFIGIPNSMLVVGIAPPEDDGGRRTEAKIMQSERSKFASMRMLDHLSPYFSQYRYLDGTETCMCVEQAAYAGLYRWVTTSEWYTRLHAKYGEGLRFNLVVGSDEKRSIMDGEWVDSDKIMKNWTIIGVKRDSFISSTAVRDIFWRDPHVKYYMVSKYISREVYDIIIDRKLYWQQDEMDDKEEEFMYLKGYNPKDFPSVGVTVDNVVMTDENNVRDRKVLLIRRGGHPYKGYWAFPGGFLDVEKDMTLLDAAYRELYEETNLGVSSVESDIMDTRQFAAYSDIGVDPRMRICDVVFVHTICNDSIRKVKADDDAVDIGWFSVVDLPRMAFNHGKIMDHIIKDAENDE